MSDQEKAQSAELIDNNAEAKSNITRIIGNAEEIKGIMEGSTDSRRDSVIRLIDDIVAKANEAKTEL